MKKITCDVMSDLLPLYSDSVCTKDSRLLVEEHLKDCADCRRLLEHLKAGCPVSLEEEPEDEKMIKDLAAVWKRSVWKSFIKGLFAASCILLLFYAAYQGLTRWPLVNINPDAVSADASVSGSSFTVHLKTTDGYKFTSMDLIPEQEGRLYVTLKRGLIPIKDGSGSSYAGTFSSSMTQTLEGKTVQINEICYGTKENHILLWKKP